MAAVSAPESWKARLTVAASGGGGASWDEALDYIADKLKDTVEQFGARGIALSDRGGFFNDLALFDAGWHQGVVGILASRIREKTHRPVIAFARDGAGNLKGSGRSIGGFHLRDALDLVTKRDPSLISKFGGHAMAAGLTIAEAAMGDFAAAFVRRSVRCVS